ATLIGVALKHNAGARIGAQEAHVGLEHGLELGANGVAVEGKVDGAFVRDPRARHLAGTGTQPAAADLAAAISVGTGASRTGTFDGAIPGAPRAETTRHESQRQGDGQRTDIRLELHRETPLLDTTLDTFSSKTVTRQDRARHPGPLAGQMRHVHP